MRPLDQLCDVDAATWIDRELGSPAPLPIRDAGFGRDVRTVMTGRQKWLVDQELADVDGDRIRLRTNAIMMLQRREVPRTGEALAGGLGKAFAEAKTGDAIEGTLVRRVDLTSGRYALIENGEEFTLVPWRPVLEKQIGKTASGIMRSDGVSWMFGRGRSGPEIG